MNQIMTTNTTLTNPASKITLWCYGLAAVMNEMNGLKLKDNYKLNKSKENIRIHKHSLARDWGIENKEDLLQSLQWLLNEGHRHSFDEMKFFLSTLSESDQLHYIESIPKTSETYREYYIVRAYMDRLPLAGIAAWDWGRYAHLCRIGAFVGYLSDDEVLELVKHVARIAQQQYSSWQEFGTSFLIGRQFWWGQTTSESAVTMARFVRNLIIHPNSVWNRLDWNQPLN
ncbi:hypothetical protein BRLA_c025180 [Brevibacillus laterosporus LMG 15441]|uniref:DUF1266 domain-containing protein n=2 Tax=Brevibacillus laterosporus TaxID=1465 RepID=A0A075R2S4_BRELA|nr:hypothetical protein BRLA_c025180 [Brevibacillus laterosporus LMG 15441]